MLLCLLRKKCTLMFHAVHCEIAMNVRNSNECKKWKFPFSGLQTHFIADSFDFNKSPQLERHTLFCKFYKNSLTIVNMVVTALHYDFSIPYEYMCSCRVVVIICALHAQGPQFDPAAQEQALFISYSISKYCNIPRHYVRRCSRVSVV